MLNFSKDETGKQIVTSDEMSIVAPAFIQKLFLYYSPKLQLVTKKDDAVIKEKPKQSCISV